MDVANTHHHEILLGYRRRRDLGISKHLRVCVWNVSSCSAAKSRQISKSQFLPVFRSMLCTFRENVGKKEEQQPGRPTTCQPWETTGGDRSCTTWVSCFFFRFKMCWDFEKETIGCVSLFLPFPVTSVCRGELLRAKPKTSLWSWPGWRCPFYRARCDDTNCPRLMSRPSLGASSFPQLDRAPTPPRLLPLAGGG
jgi:hypothetical protein